MELPSDASRILLVARGELCGLNEVNPDPFNSIGYLCVSSALAHFIAVVVSPLVKHTRGQK